MKKTKAKKTRDRGGFYLLKGSVYKYDMVIGINVTKEQLLEHFNTKFVNALTHTDKKGIENVIDSGAKGFCAQLENKALVLWTRDYPKTPIQYSTLVHEIFHATEFIMRMIGMPLSEDSSEAYAHLLGWITKEIFTVYEL